MKTKAIAALVVAIAALSIPAVSSAGRGGGSSPCAHSVQYNRITGVCKFEDLQSNNPPVLYTGGN